MNIKSFLDFIKTIIFQVAILIALTVLMLLVIIPLLNTLFSSFLGYFLKSNIMYAVLEIGLALIILIFLAVQMHKRTNMSFSKQIFGALIIILISTLLLISTEGMTGLLYLGPIIMGGIWGVIALIGWAINKKNQIKK